MITYEVEKHERFWPDWISLKKKKENPEKDEYNFKVSPVPVWLLKCLTIWIIETFEY